MEITRSDREINVCKIIMPVLSRRKGEEFIIFGRPDQIERNREAVDFLLRSKTTSYAVEHTLIESHPDRMRDDAHFIRLLQPLEEKLSGVLPMPGSYHLAVEFGAVKGAKKENEIRDAIETWIRSKAPTLEIGSPRTAPRHYFSEIPRGVPFRVSLYRWPTSNGRFFIERFVPEDLEKERKLRLKRALDDKCPKLHRAKSHHGNVRSLLILESNDIAISNHIAIGSAFKENALGRPHDNPDEVFLVESGVVWVLKDGEEMFPHVNEPGPYYS